MKLISILNLFTRKKSIDSVKEEIEGLVQGGNISYSTTNENLDAIVAGLDLKPEDNVLAIAGSGDQAFAMLEHGCRVTAIDVHANQIKLCRLRTEALKIGNQDVFLIKSKNPYSTVGNGRDEYFAKEGRIERIRANIGNLKILRRSNIFRLRGKEIFSKIYLSNALEHNMAEESSEERLIRIEKLLSPKGLVYVTYNDHESYVNQIFLSRVNSLTDEARKYEILKGYRWCPTVYQKEAAK